MHARRYAIARDYGNHDLLHVGAAGSRSELGSSEVRSSPLQPSEHCPEPADQGLSQAFFLPAAPGPPSSTHAQVVNLELRIGNGRVFTVE